MCGTDSAIVHETAALEPRLIALHALDRPGSSFRHCLVATIEFGEDSVLNRRRKFLRMASTSDAALDDPTVRRCRGFAKLWDCNGLAVASLYALRSTNPAALWAHHDPVRPDNDRPLDRRARMQ
ncbi:DUF1643 domain-containing protein [Paraburkholderia hospita]|jgi:hypothetical protein|uniref:DUF1643 domain-containing protein n=2 Tax=Paraburkholderia hospita TaxID=169430 RepID=UPI0026BE0654